MRPEQPCAVGIQSVIPHPGRVPADLPVSGVSEPRVRRQRQQLRVRRHCDLKSLFAGKQRRIKGAWSRARGSAFLRVGRGQVSVRSGPRLGTAETRAGRLDAPSAAALSVQDGVPAGESVQHAGGAVPRHDIIGEFTTSYRELSRGQSQFNVYEVVNPKKKGKKKKYTNSGTVMLRSFLVETEVSFLDYIKGGAVNIFSVTAVNHKRMSLGTQSPAFSSCFLNSMLWR
ncbi:uncharacterized protein [Oryctolagus cuniculus]|uniref:uncharacterized protein n=1 Tax=Oryctolagus cuniculus TaxID=9986 RepID=UPI003879B986